MLINARKGILDVASQWPLSPKLDRIYSEKSPHVVVIFSSHWIFYSKYTLQHLLQTWLCTKFLKVILEFMNNNHRSTSAFMSFTATSFESQREKVTVFRATHDHERTPGGHNGTRSHPPLGVSHKRRKTEGHVTRVNTRVLLSVQAVTPARIPHRKCRARFCFCR